MSITLDKLYADYTDLDTGLVQYFDSLQQPTFDDQDIKFILRYTNAIKFPNLKRSLLHLHRRETREDTNGNIVYVYFKYSLTTTSSSYLVNNPLYKYSVFPRILLIDNEVMTNFSNQSNATKDFAKIAFKSQKEMLAAKYSFYRYISEIKNQAEGYNKYIFETMAGSG